MTTEPTDDDLEPEEYRQTLTLPGLPVITAPAVPRAPRSDPPPDFPQTPPDASSV